MIKIYCSATWRSKWLILAISLISIKSNAFIQDSASITIHVTNTPIELVFREIEKQTGYSFYYSKPTLDGNESVSVNLNKASLPLALNTVLKGKNVNWQLKNGGIVLSRKTPTNYTANDTIKKVTISGTVSTDEGFNLPGATVQVIGTNIGTASNQDGQFQLTNIPDRSKIAITYTGYQSQVFNTKGSETLIIKLKRVINSLDEQVVIAYGTSSRRMLTGSIGKIKSEEISKQPVTNVLAALQAQVPGLIITQQTGVPGGGFRVSIRGTNSLRNNLADYQSGNNGNDPLYIIDGIPYFSKPQSMSQVSNSGSIYPIGSGANPLNNINPTDIESVEILKDADATAIYGSRGANGVILITTKKGKMGDMKIDANFYTGAGSVARKMKLLNTPQYLEMRTEAFKNDNVTTYPSYAYDLNGTWEKDRYTDWQKELIGGTAHSTDGQLSISGGTANTQYRFGGGIHKETTVFPGDFSHLRASASLSLNNTSPNGKFKTGIVANYSYGVSNLLSQDLTVRALQLPPNAPALYKQDGSLNFQNSTWSNPLTYTKQPYLSKSNALISNASLSYEIIKNLEVSSNIGFTRTTMNQILKTPISSIDPNLPAAQKINRSVFQNGFVNSWNIEPQLNYSINLPEHHQISILFGTTFYRETTESLNQSASGFLSESLMDNVSAVPAANVINTFNNSLYSYNAVFGRLNYTFQRKYIFNFSGRRDGSSRFGPGRQFANFGSVGAAWILSEEKFFRERLGAVNFAKIRASYGTSGNDQIPNYGFQDTYTTTGAGQYQNTTGLRPSQLVNTDFSWESTQKFETAVDLETLKGRLKLTAAYYSNKSSNQLVGYPLPSNTGFGTVQYNLPATVVNKGWELELSGIIFNKNNFRWSSSLNVSRPYNKLTSYPNLENSSYASSYAVGEPLAIRKVYKYLGVDPQTGLHQVLDIDKNGLYNSVDRYINLFIGQRLNGGLSNSFTYKGFQLDVLLQFADQDAPNYVGDFAMPGEMTNFPVEVMNRWRNVGDITSIQKFSASNAYLQYSNFYTSDAAITDASFIRLKNASLSYSLSNAFIKHINLSSLRIYMLAQNLFTITNYKGLDPETQGAVLPPLKMITAGIQVTL